MISLARLHVLSCSVAWQILKLQAMLLTIHNCLQWTDDTSMALCLAESLIECRGFNPVDQLKRYCEWYQVSC